MKEIQLAPELIRDEEYIGRTAPQILKLALDRGRPGWKTEDYDLLALTGRKNDFYLELARTELRAYPGVKEGLEWLKSEGVKTAVVSNGRKREVSAALQLLQLAPLMDQVITRDDVQPPKPDPTPYLFGAASLGVEPAHCIAIEDSPPGLEAALQAKIPVGAVTSNLKARDLQYPVPGRPDLSPSWIGPNMVTFFEWIRGLPRR